MANLTFDENNEYYIKSKRYLGNSEKRPVVKFLIQHRIVSNGKQANVVLLIFSTLALTTSICLLLSMTGNPITDQVTAPDGTTYEVEEYVRMITTDTGESDQ